MWLFADGPAALYSIYEEAGGTLLDEAHTPHKPGTPNVIPSPQAFRRMFQQLKDLESSTTYHSQEIISPGT